MSASVDRDGTGTLTPRHKSALLWGAVGSLSFLVSIQGYALLLEPLVSLPRAFLVALLVGIGAALVAYALEHRIAARAAARVEE
ncbi:hypothetical protein ACFQGT_07015 [Natrialbaceae archaeon GCM10025810]|uniref:hypothetical protein n=1 Tax=Halovalidus salilacus TaxID=3075124 RepID=UPI0036101BF3